MTEDRFHLTPLDIRTQPFAKSLRGYDPSSVEEFRERVASEFERLLREKAILDEQVSSFREQLKAFREREKAMSDGLVLAQQLRDDSEQAARKDAAEMLQGARGQAETIVQEARLAEQSVRQQAESGRRQLQAYLASFRVLLERHLSELEALETHERDGDTTFFRNDRNSSARTSAGLTPNADQPSNGRPASGS